MKDIEILLQMVNKAYWNNRNDCGGDFKGKDCVECPDYSFCKLGDILNTRLAKIVNAATEAEHDAEQPQQPFCASGDDKLPSFDVLFVEFCRINNFVMRDTDDLELFYNFLLEKLGNFTKR
jgi:hypothetical protein